MILSLTEPQPADHVGGHIASSQHHASSTLGTYMPTLIRSLHEQGVEMVVFHCALSQQRGPSAAKAYVRERGRVLGDKVGDRNVQVLILEGGFVKWQEKYGRDERLTTDYAPDIWIDYC